MYLSREGEMDILGTYDISKSTLGVIFIVARIVGIVAIPYPHDRTRITWNELLFCRG